jgi:hemerythrin-like metal-binding protein
MIQWSPQYAVGVKLIDEQHQKFFATFNDLYDAFLKGEAEDRLAIILKELSDYVEFHFATEEKYFKEFDYAETAEHILQHDDFRTQIEEFKKHFFKEKDLKSLAGELVELLDNWFTKHVAELDQKYVSCFKEHGLE